eukprot:sb/3466098/
MPSFLSSKKDAFLKAAKSKKAEKKRPESASSQKSETHSTSSTATVRPIQREEAPAPVAEKQPEQPIDIIDEEKAMALKLDGLQLSMPKSKSDTGFNNYHVSPTPPIHITRTNSYGDVKNIHAVKSNPPTPVSFNNSPRCDSLSRGDRSIAMSRNRREATYCKILLRNAAHRRSNSRLSQKLSGGEVRYHRDTETPSELTYVSSLSSFGSMNSFQSNGSLNSHHRDEIAANKDANMARAIAKDNKTKMTQLLVLARRRQLAQDDLRRFTLKDVAVCGSRMDRSFLLQEVLHYSGVMYPVKLVSTDDLMFPNKKLAIKVRERGGMFRHVRCVILFRGSFTNTSVLNFFGTNFALGLF